MKRRAEFLDVLLRGAGPSLELLGAFAAGLIAISIFGNLIYDVLVEPQRVAAAVLRPVAALPILVGLAYLLYRLDKRRRLVARVTVDDSRVAPPYAGLIWLLGPGSVDHLLFALKHHREGGGATHCWLVMQSGVEEIQQAYAAAAMAVLEHSLDTRLYPCYIQELEAQEAYRAVHTIFEREAAEEGMEPGDVIADITSGTKPLTAGMVLAALIGGRALEYVETERDEHGNPIFDTARVVLVDTKFYVGQEP